MATPTATGCECGCGSAVRPGRRYVSGHNTPTLDLRRPFYVVGPDGCWTWARARFRTGYGAIKRGGRVQYAHRWLYLEHGGVIPDGFDLHHACRNRACVNPAHLAPIGHAAHAAFHRGGE